MKEIFLVLLGKVNSSNISININCFLFGSKSLEDVGFFTLRVRSSKEIYRALISDYKFLKYMY